MFIKRCCTILDINVNWIWKIKKQENKRHTPPMFLFDFTKLAKLFNQLLTCDVIERNQLDACLKKFKGKIRPAFSLKKLNRGFV